MNKNKVSKSAIKKRQKQKVKAKNKKMMERVKLGKNQQNEGRHIKVNKSPLSDFGTFLTSKEGADHLQKFTTNTVRVDLYNEFEGYKLTTPFLNEILSDNSVDITCIGVPNRSDGSIGRSIYTMELIFNDTTKGEIFEQVNNGRQLQFDITAIEMPSKDTEGLSVRIVCQLNNRKDLNFIPMMRFSG